MWPVLFHLGPLTIYSYGTMMAIGFLVAGYLSGREMTRKGMNGELASTMVVWAAVGGLVGSRIWALAGDWEGVVRDPMGSVFSGSGFVWYGGLLGGTAAVTWVIWRHGLSWLRVVDAIAPALALGHAIGRIGCQLAGDGDWGTVSDLPWAMAYPNAIVEWNYPPGVRVHPTPVYEMLAYGLVFAVLWWRRKRPAPDGSLFWQYLVLAGAGRFGIEFVRINPAVWLGLSQAQFVSLALVAIGVWRLAVQHTATMAKGRAVARSANR